MAIEFFLQKIGGYPIWILLVTIWDLIWRGFAVWKSTRKNHPLWSLAFLLLQTAGILPILYIYLFSEMNKRKAVKKKR